MTQAKNPNLQDIVTDWLKQHGYDGLYNTVGECACQVSDLVPCSQCDELECHAGHYLDATNSEFDFEIGVKPEESEEKE